MSNTQKTIIGFFIIIIGILTFLFIRDYAYLNNWAKPIDSIIFAHWGSCVSGLMATGAFVYAFTSFINQKRSNEKKEAEDKIFQSKKNFENRFFKLVENLQFIVSQISITMPMKEKIENDKIITEKMEYNSIFITDPGLKIKYRLYDNRPIKIEGREALHILLVNLLQALRVIKIDDIWDEEQTDQQREKLRYNEFYNRYFYLLGHYFRFFYRILVFIDSNDIIDKKEKQLYADLLQAQISTDEMGLIFYNAILNEKAKKKATGEEKFHLLLEDYKILENIDLNSVIKEAHLVRYYPKTFTTIQYTGS